MCQLDLLPFCLGLDFGPPPPPIPSTLGKRLTGHTGDASGGVSVLLESFLSALKHSLFHFAALPHPFFVQSSDSARGAAEAATSEEEEEEDLPASFISPARAVN